MYAGVALGIRQSNQLCLMDFENEMLGMTEKMVPLQSSYTTSGTNQGGRPEKAISDKAEQTVKSDDAR